MTEMARRTENDRDEQRGDRNQPRGRSQSQRGAEKYGKLREKATRAERKEATLDDLRGAAAELKGAAAALASVQERLAERARSLDESALILSGGSGDPVRLYQARLKEGFEKAAADVDFYGMSKAAVDGLAASASDTLAAVEEASRTMKWAWDSERIRRYVAVMARAVLPAAIVMAVACVALTATCFAKMEPLFTGKAVVSYTPEYESELDRTRLELAFAQNELEAYRMQYPGGIGPTAQADLDAANQAAQDAYDAERAG